MQAGRRPDAEEGTMVAVRDPASSIHMDVHLRGIWKDLSSFNAKLEGADGVAEAAFRSLRDGQALIGSELQAQKGPVLATT